MTETDNTALNFRHIHMQQNHVYLPIGTMDYGPLHMFADKNIHNNFLTQDDGYNYLIPYNS